MLDGQPPLVDGSMLAFEVEVSLFVGHFHHWSTGVVIQVFETDRRKHMNSWSTSCFPIFGLHTSTMFKWSQICTFGCPNSWKCQMVDHVSGVFLHFPMVFLGFCPRFTYVSHIDSFGPAMPFHPTCHPGGRFRPSHGVLYNGYPFNFTHFRDLYHEKSLYI